MQWQKQTLKCVKKKDKSICSNHAKSHEHKKKTHKSRINNNSNNKNSTIWSPSLQFVACDFDFFFSDHSIYNKNSLSCECILYAITICID